MAAAAMAAAATGTRRPHATTTSSRLLPNVSYPAFSLTPISSSSVVALNNFTSRSAGIVGQILRCPSTRSSCGCRRQEFGLTRPTFVGFTGVLSGRKKCRVAAVVAEQQQRLGGAVRDKVVEFGKFKGSKMGTLTSRYLKWMVNNLKAGPLSEWSEYAKEVLADPYYKDRLEWEKVEKLMTAAHDVASITGNREVVLAPARAYGWDLKDDAGWRRVNFALIGTTEGGRIPRTKTIVPPAVEEKKKAAPRTKKPVSIRTTTITTTTTTTTASMRSPSSSASWAVHDSSSSGSLREELLRRRAQRRDRLMPTRGLLPENAEAEEAQRMLSRFPGRESLLSTVRGYDITE